MSKEKPYLSPLSEELEALLQPECRKCALGRRMILLAGGTRGEVTSETRQTAQNINNFCSGYREDLEDPDIVAGTNTIFRLKEFYDNPACPYTKLANP